MKKHFIYHFIKIALFYMLTGCGQSGHLYLPDYHSNLTAAGK
jgi:predicted small lipoprotein YifL